MVSRERSSGTAIDNPDIKAYSESFGIKGYCPTIMNELKSQLEFTINSKELSVMKIKVNSSVIKKLLEKLNSYWKDDQHVKGH